MDCREKLEIRIEQLRTEMYLAFERKDQYDRVIKISQELDSLLNKLEKLKNDYK